MTDASGEGSVSYFEAMPEYDEMPGEQPYPKYTEYTLEPDVEWLLSPSIKYQLAVEHRPVRELDLEPVREKSVPDVDEVVELEISTENEEEEEDITETRQEEEDTVLIFDNSNVLNSADSKMSSLTFIPNVEWLLIPSIKYKLLMDGDKKPESRKPSSDNCENIHLPLEDLDIEALPMDEGDEWLLPSSIKYNMMIEARRNAKLDDLRQKCLRGGVDFSPEDETTNEEEEEESMLDGEGNENAGETSDFPVEVEIYNRPLRDLEEMRWFAYILNTAHHRRPRFIPAPKRSVKEMRYGAVVAPISASFQSLKLRSKKRAVGSRPESVKSQKTERAEGGGGDADEVEGEDVKKKKDAYEVPDLPEDVNPVKGETKTPKEFTVLTAEVSQASNPIGELNSDITDTKVDDSASDNQELKEVYKAIEKAWREVPKRLNMRPQDRNMKKAIMVRSALLAAQMSLLNTIPGAGIDDGEKRKAEGESKKKKLIENKMGDLPFTAKVLGQCIDFTFN